ncbi:DUF6907 domain-containing protein [Nonomuraea insulae]|uniref:DUF6907 domain-containing protein n=1 Tax=Nonomuraea insulae TaxID=1616787 RepID=A0ABW1DCC5_9ACTN
MWLPSPSSEAAVSLAASSGCGAVLEMACVTITCPEWCTESHLATTGSVLHRAELRTVNLSLEDVGYTPTLFIELVQQDPGEIGPVIRLRVGELRVADLKPGEALSTALRLIGLTELVIRS